MKLKEILFSNIFYMILFITGIYIFEPGPVERLAFSLILVAFLFYMVTVFMTILTFAAMPFTRKLLEGSDMSYGVSERKYALLFFGMLALSIAILLGNVIPDILIAAYSTSV